MKKTFVLFGILTVFLLSCISLSAKTKKKIINLNETSWELSQIIKRGKEQEFPQNANITINFADNKINGNSGVNRYFGGYKIKNNSILTANAATTLMAGPEELMKIEQRFLEILQNSPRITYSNTTLSLRSKNGEIWTFEKLDLKEKLIDTKWKLSEMGQTKLPEKEITISFDKNKVNGNSGVNNYFGSYEIKNNSIKIGPVGSTRMAGPENLMKIEFEYLKLLQDSKTIEFNNKLLILTTNDGKVLKFEKIDDRAYHY
ncbi:META domain-containing protein [Leptotrichia sp.]|uniref:META domain-containing protein n=1 Tax=Leptotrichia sp. TaxID=104608 RepID=UPI0017A15C7F|nr:META domain-containing protein [Leptotrichia sp.]MBB1535649.1 META domain-containing protein [Leptotrichia sp.]